jgi:hypothetical protein
MQQLAEDRVFVYNFSESFEEVINIPCVFIWLRPEATPGKIDVFFVEQPSTERPQRGLSQGASV